MRPLAVCCILAVVAWAAAVARNTPTGNRQIAPPVYAVGAPVATTLPVLIPAGDAPPASTVAVPVLPPAAPDAATVDAQPDRGEAIQVTPTVPPPSVSQAVGLHGLPLAPVGLSACSTAAFYRAQAGLPSRFDGIIWRESNCDPTVRNWCCTGLAQIHRLWVPKLAQCDVYVRDDLFDPQRNMCAAAYVYAVQGIDAWSTA